MDFEWEKSESNSQSGENNTASSQQVTDSRNLGGEQSAPTQGASAQGTTEQGTASQGTTSQGAYQQGTASQGTTSQGTYQQGTASQGTTSQETYQQRVQSKYSQNYNSKPDPEPEDDDKKNKKKGSNKIVVIIVCIVLAGIAAGAAFFGIKSIANKDSSTDATTEAGETATDETYDKVGTVETADYSNAASLDISDMVEQVLPSLVSITNVSVTDTQNYYYYFFNGGSTQQESVEQGSGVIVGQSDTELLVVTNAHVIEDAQTLTLTFNDGKSYEAYVKGSDSDVDIAVVAVKLSDMKESLSEIKVATFGDSDSAKVGEQVVAIGNAAGEGQSVTTGIISAFNKQLSTSTAGLIQTDAAINPGNSGGALFNMQGEVIGINNSKYVSTQYEGMGFAIPASVVKPLAEEFMTRETRDKVDTENASSIGIKGQDVSEEVAEAYGIPEGVYITEIVDGGACDKAGVPVNAIITKFDGVSVTTMSKLKDTLLYYAAGETVTITCKVNENGTYVDKEYTLTLGKKDTSTTDSNTETSSANQYGNGNYDGGNSGNNGWSFNFGY